MERETAVINRESLFYGVFFHLALTCNKASMHKNMHTMAI